MNGADEPSRPVGRGLTAIFAVSCGAIVANIYYAQALIGPISAALHLHAALAGLIVTLTQLGYGAGLLFLVPLADLLENRRLVRLTLLAAALAAAAVGAATGTAGFLVGSFALGLFSVGAQILVPFAAHLAPPAVRGRMIGNVMGGLIAGIMLARPIASLTASLLGWRAIFLVAAAFMLVLSLLLGRVLPRRAPAAGMHYGQILITMARLLLHEPVLRRRACGHGLLFATFSLFWTTVPLLLADRFGLGQGGIALFALAGAGGALAAPAAGRLADRDLSRPTLLASALLVGGALALSALAWHAAALIGLCACAVVLDAGVQTSQICSQRALYALAPALRGRLTAVYMALVFLAGAIGSLASTTFYAAAGWPAVVLIGVVLSLAALAVWFRERAPA